MVQRRRVNPPAAIPPLTVTSSPTSSNWKDHPIAVASIAVAATIALAVLLVKEIIIPTHTAALTNQVASLSSQSEVHSAEMSSLRASKSDVEKNLAQAQVKIAELNRELSLAQHANLFLFGSSYPVGLGQVVVGDPVEKLAAIYPDDSIEKSKVGYWTINDRHKVFNRITYYYDKKIIKSPVTHINFSIDYPLTFDDSFLQSKLVEAHGEPKKWQSDGFFSWSTKAKVVLYKNSNGSFMVMKADYRPGTWPDE